MKIFYPFLILLFSVMSLRGQTVSRSAYSSKFKADSLGKNGFRNSGVVYDTTKNVTLVNGVSMIGWTRRQMEAKLGASNDVMINEKTITLSYLIYNNIWTDGGLLIREVNFVVVDNVITSVYLSAAH